MMASSLRDDSAGFHFHAEPLGDQHEVTARDPPHENQQEHSPGVPEFAMLSIKVQIALY